MAPSTSSSSQLEGRVLSTRKCLNSLANRPRGSWRKMWAPPCLAHHLTWTWTKGPEGRPSPSQGPPGGLKSPSLTLFPPFSSIIAPDLGPPPLCWLPNCPGIPLAKSLLGSPYHGHPWQDCHQSRDFPKSFPQPLGTKYQEGTFSFQWEGSGKEMGSLDNVSKEIISPKILGLQQAGDRWGQCAPLHHPVEIIRAVWDHTNVLSQE